jgi:hypothetical protein
MKHFVLPNGLNLYKNTKNPLDIIAVELKSNLRLLTDLVMGQNDTSLYLWLSSRTLLYSLRNPFIIVYLKIEG